MHFVSSLLFGVAERDPATLAIVGCVLGGIAFVACVIPVRRGAKVDPTQALRSE